MFPAATTAALLFVLCQTASSRSMRGGYKSQGDEAICMIKTAIRNACMEAGAAKEKIQGMIEEGNGNIRGEMMNLQEMMQRAMRASEDAGRDIGNCISDVDEATKRLDLEVVADYYPKNEMEKVDKSIQDLKDAKDALVRRIAAHKKTRNGYGGGCGEDDGETAAKIVDEEMMDIKNGIQAAVKDTYTILEIDIKEFTDAVEKIRNDFRHCVETVA